MKDYGYEVRSFGDEYHHKSFESALRHAKTLFFAKIVDCSDKRYIWQTGDDMI